ncbi:MAG: hypothetical protein R2792_17320 [Saprospiraceae bacterium]
MKQIKYEVHTSLPQKPNKVHTIPPAVTYIPNAEPQVAMGNF